MTKEFKYSIEHINKAELQTKEDLLEKMQEHNEGKTKEDALFVANLNKAIATELGLDKDGQKKAFETGKYYDVGMIGLEPDFINFNGKYTIEMRDEMRKHVDGGKELLEHVGAEPYIIEASDYHHRDFDGGGYGNEAKEKDIPELARITRVSDSIKAFDNRTDKPMEALDDIRNPKWGNPYDSEIVDAYEKVHIKVKEKLKEQSIDTPTLADFKEALESAYVIELEQEQEKDNGSQQTSKKKGLTKEDIDELQPKSVDDLFNKLDEWDKKDKKQKGKENDETISKDDDNSQVTNGDTVNEQDNDELITNNQTVESEITDMQAKNDKTSAKKTEKVDDTQVSSDESPVKKENSGPKKETSYQKQKRLNQEKDAKIDWLTNEIAELTKLSSHLREVVTFTRSELDAVTNELNKTKGNLEISQATSHEFYQESKNSKRELSETKETLAKTQEHLEISQATSHEFFKENQETKKKLTETEKRLAKTEEHLKISQETTHEMFIDKEIATIFEGVAVEEKEQAKKQQAYLSGLLKKAVNNELSLEETEILKEEYRLTERGHEFNNSLSIEERKNKVNNALLIEDVRDKEERKKKWAHRKSVTSAVLKTARDIVIKHKPKQMNKNIVVPADVSAKEIKKELHKDIIQEANVEKASVSFFKKANQALKKTVLHSTTIEKKEEIAKEGWGFVVSRAASAVGSNIKTNFAKKFADISKPAVDKWSKVKKTYNKHLNTAKQKDVTQSKEKKKNDLSM